MPRYQMREIYLTWVDTVIEAKNKEEAETIFACIPRDHSQIDENKMFQQEELEEVDAEHYMLTPLSDFDKQVITNELGYSPYKGFTPQPKT